MNTSFLFVPTILFLTIVAPLWLVLHYRSSRRSSRSLNQNDLELLEELLADIDKMQDRIGVLESILDHDHPKWSQKNSSKREVEGEVQP